MEPENLSRRGNMNFKSNWLIALAMMVLFGVTASAQEELRDLMMDAQSLSQSGDFEKAVEKLRKVEEQAPDNPGVIFMLGYNLHAAGKIDEAIKYHKKAAEGSGEQKVLGLYNLACAYSIQDKKDDAFKALEKSIAAGYYQPDQIEHTQSDPDLKNIKSDPRFAEMIAMMKNGGKKPEMKKLTKKDLFGNWKVTSGMRAGSKVDGGRLPMIEVTEKTFTIPAGEGQKFVMSYKVNMDTKPIEVDFKIESGPVPEGNAKGIIKFENDVMNLCYEPTGNARPEKFISTEENKYFVFKMKKASGGIAKDMVGKWKCVKGTRGGDEVAAERMESVITVDEKLINIPTPCLLYTSPSRRDATLSRMPSSA